MKFYMSTLIVAAFTLSCCNKNTNTKSSNNTDSVSAYDNNSMPTNNSSSMPTDSLNTKSQNASIPNPSRIDSSQKSKNDQAATRIR